uniref:BAH domain-containing protein n=1 Tax=Lygus hesperus TaxID=30085 RepID=A0A0K8TC03_LYGHE
MLGSPTRAPRIWLDPPPAHSNGLSRYQLYSLEAEPRLAHLPPSYIQPQKYEEQVLRRSVSQLSCHQLFAEEKKISQKEVCPCKPLTGWSEKGLRDGGCSRTTPRAIVKSESARVPTPCQVPEVTTSSKTDIQGSTSGGIPVGIAIARQRVQQTNPSSPLTVQLTACQDRGPQPSPWPSSLMPSHHYQIRGPDQGMTSAIQSPFQLVRDPMTGQFMLLPAASPTLACLSLEGAVQRAIWTGPPPLQVMAPHPHTHAQPQPLMVDRLVTLAPSSQPDKRSVVQVPCDFSKSSPAAQQGLLIHPTMSPHQAFSTLLVHNMPFAATTANHQNSFLLSTQLTEQALINQGGVVISNHLENTVINPQIIGGCPESSFSPQTPAHVPSSFLHHMSPSVVISSHTETNSFVRDLTPSVITALDNQVIVKSEMKSEPLCTMDQATSPPTIEVKPEVVTEEYTEEEEERTTIVADAQNQTETPSNSEEEDTQSSVKLQTELSIPKQEPQEEVEEQETSVVQQETTQIVTTQITRTTWTTEQTHHGTLQIEQEEIKEEVEEVVEREQESQSSAVDLSGLELLSNTTIAQHENYHNSSPEPEDDDSASGGGNDMGGLAVLCQAADFAMSQPHFIPVGSSSTTSVVIQESTTTTSSTTTATVSAIEVDESSEDDHSRKLSPPRLLPIQAVEKMREVPLKEAFKVLRAKKVKEKKCAPFRTISGVEEESPTVEPPVLEPWSATPQRVTPPLGPPTLTPNKKRSCDSPESSEDTDFTSFQESYGSAPPPLKKRKFGRLPPKKFENSDETQGPSVEMEVVQVQPVQAQDATKIDDDLPKNKIRPKLKAETKVKAPGDENEEEIYESSLELVPAQLSPSWRFKQSKPTNEKAKLTVKKVKTLKVKPISPRPPTSPKATQDVAAPENKASYIQAKSSQCLPVTRLTESDLKDVPLPIMMFSGGHFVPAQVTDIKAPGIYEVIYLRNPRNRRPQILCTEELLNSAIREVKLENLAVPAGTRVCSYWSQEYNFMYSGVVSAPSGPDEKFVFVEFDDGDDGKINRDDIRLLPEELNLTDYDPEPSSPLMGRRRRTSDSKSSPEQPKTPSIKVKPLLPPPEEEEEEEMETDPEEGEEAAPSTMKSDETDESVGHSVGSEEISEAGSDTPPAIYIKNKVKDFLQTEKEKKEKRRLKKEKKRRLLEKCCKRKHSHKHSHRDGCRSHHKQNSELRIKNSTVSKTGTESGNHKGPLVTTIAKPSVSVVEEERKDEEEDDDEEEEEPSSCTIQAVAKASKFAAFLPARHELWTWHGTGSKRGRGSGQKRGRKIFYKAIQRGSDVINVGDCAVFVSTGRPDRPFIGQVESFWGTQKNSMAVKVSWFYHPEETVGAPEMFPFPGALFKSPHTDSNDVQTISHRCEVVSLPEFKARVDRKEVSTETVYDNQEVYYLAGFYDPQDTSIKYEPGIIINQQ